jgi:outer membrane autotransporter protein
MNLWMQEDNLEGSALTLGSFMGTVTFYPGVSSGFFLKGGAGVALVDNDFKVGTLSATLSKYGWGALAGVGYDIRVGRNTSLTPCINFQYGSVGDIAFKGVTFGNWKHNVISLELGITFH